MLPEAWGKSNSLHSSYLEAVWTKACTAPSKVSLAGGREGGEGEGGRGGGREREERKREGEGEGGRGREREEEGGEEEGGEGEGGE